MIFSDRNVSVSLFFLFLFGIASLACYLWVARIEQPSDSLFSGIRIGQQFYDVFHNNRCVGGFQIEFKEDPALTVVLRGAVRVRFRGKVYSARLFAGSFFNSLNQLVSSNMQVESEGRAFLLNLSQPNPLRARVISVQDGRTTLLRELELPGPVELVRASDSSYRLSYVGLRGNIQRMLQQFSPLQSLPQNMTMPLLKVENGAGDGTCGRGEEEGFSIDELIDRLPGGGLPLPFVGMDFFSSATGSAERP